LLLDLYSLDLLPAAYGSEEELSRSFADLERKLIRCVKALERSEFPSDTKRPIFNRLALNLNGFFTAYFQKNVVEVMKQYSKLLSHVLGLTERSVDRKRRRDGKIRLGIASGLLRSHNGVNWAYNWVSQLPNDYDFFTYAFNSSSDELTDKFSNLGTHRFLKFDKDNLQETIEVMKCDEIDILMLPDVGMTPESRILASHRIAPVQFTAWGHPVTTGSSNVDYFVSSDLMEPDDAQLHYSETLVRLPNLALFLTPSPSLEIGTQKFEFPAGRILFGCLQSIFKYLPQYDFVYPLIAKHIPQSLFVFLEAEHLYATDIFKERLLKEFVLHGLDFHKHVKFLPRVSASNYIGLMSKMDVILDSIGWTGGNTSLQAIELGKPIVTVPGEFMRGRHTYAMLKMMGLDDHCSNSLGAYVDRAVALGSNGSLRTHVGSEILERKQLLYEDRAFIDAFDKFLKGALERHIPGSARVGE
jgi:Predicted O-linked N-acetylglucosamine transferase, SPINDLY family